MRTECLLTAMMLLAWASADQLKAVAPPTLFKCVSGRGEVSFQSAPCANGARMAWSRSIVPEPAPPPHAAAKSVGARSRSQSSSPSGRVRGGESSRSTVPSACDAAKAHRADVRDRQWRTIRFDQLRSLDDDVARACQHR